MNLSSCSPQVHFPSGAASRRCGSASVADEAREPHVSTGLPRSLAGSTQSACSPPTAADRFRRPRVLTRSCFGGVRKQELEYLEATSPPLKPEATVRLPLSPSSAHRRAPQFAGQFVATKPSSSNSSC